MNGTFYPNLPARGCRFPTVRQPGSPRCQSDFLLKISCSSRIDTRKRQL